MMAWFILGILAGIALGFWIAGITLSGKQADLLAKIQILIQENQFLKNKLNEVSNGKYRINENK